MKANNAMGQKLFGVTKPKVVFSPTSIAYAFSLMHLASTGNTDKQLIEVFDGKNTFENLSDVQKLFNSSIIKMANCFIVNENFRIKDEYMKAVQDLAMVCSRNFSQSVAVANECNQFIRQGTNNLIDNIVQPEMITSDTVSLLINTLYFKTVWKKPFKKHLTTEKLFDNKTMVPMMKQKKFMQYFEDEQVQMIELVYKDEEYGMVIVLPKNTNIKECASYLFNDITFKYEHVDCEIPKFTQRTNMDLKPLFQKLGVTDLFSESNCMLSNMRDEKIYVSDAIHEAVVIVDEEGTEAAAVTVIRSMNECCKMEPDYIQFYAHRPFIYGIRHRSSNNVLFAGDYHGDK